MTSSGVSEVLPAAPHPQPCPTGPASLGGKLARDLRLPSSRPSLRRAWHLAPFYLPSLNIFASVLETSWGEASTPTPGAPPPPPPRGVCDRKGREGLQGSAGKGPQKSSWDGSEEAVKMDLHWEEKAAGCREVATGGIRENSAHQTRCRGREGATTPETETEVARGGWSPEVSGRGRRFCQN